MITTNPDNFLWVEKYRPKRISDCIFTDKVVKQLQPMVDKGELQNLMFIGSAGVGKTTAAKALCEELGIDYLVINCSENGNIDTIRTTVRTFASSVSLMGGFKCVIFDEADGLSTTAMQALRNFIEEFSNNCRFIFTANFGNKIIEPLKSRTVQVDMSMTKEEKVKLIVKFDARVKEILKLEGVEEYDKKVLATLITKYFPDFRKTLGTLQNLTLTGTLDASAMSNVTVDEVATIFKFLKAKDFTSMRKWVAENPDNDLPVLAKMLWGKVDSFVEHDSIPQFVLHLNQYQINHASVIDKEINLVAMLTELMADIRYK